MNNSPVILLLAPFAALIACTEPGPSVWGIISWRDPEEPRMVVGLGPACEEQARVYYGGVLTVSRRRQPSDTSQLIVGRRVTVWVMENSTDTCPRGFSASRIHIED
jgi:hypothetical protein